MEMPFTPSRLFRVCVVKVLEGECMFLKLYPTSDYHFLWQVFAAEVVVSKKGSPVQMQTILLGN
jgi:hypothetical protein